MSFKIRSRIPGQFLKKVGHSAVWRDVFFARSEQIVFNNFVGRPKNFKFWKRRGCSMSKMTLSSKEQKIFSNTIWPIVSGAHLFLEKVGDIVGMIFKL